jgi:hypothetical protein
MEIKKNTFGKSILKTLLFESVALILVWGIIVIQLVQDHYQNPYDGAGINLSSLAGWSNHGILNGQNGTRTMFLLVAIFTLIFVFYSYFRNSNLKTGEKIILSFCLSIIGFLFFIILFLLIYGLLIGSPFY